MNQEKKPMEGQKQKRWVEQMLAEHAKLRATLDDVRSFLDEPRPEPGSKGSHTWATTMSQHLVKLHDQLYRHFRAEEQEGMMRDLATRFPRAWRRVEMMLGEHAVILSEMRQLMSSAMEYGEGIRPEDTRLRRRLTSVLDRLDTHESGETELMQRMLYNDIGTGD
jgi:regulator of replication initiation timing